MSVRNTVMARYQNLAMQLGAAVAEKAVLQDRINGLLAEIKKLNESLPALEAAEKAQNATAEKAQSAAKKEQETSTQS